MTAAAANAEVVGRRRDPRAAAEGRRAIRVPIATKLILSFLAAIAIMSIVFLVVGVRLVGDRVVAEAHAKVQHDLNAAREMNLSRLENINDVVRLTADRFFLSEAVASGSVAPTVGELAEVMAKEDLDVLTVTDASGVVLLRAGNAPVLGDDQSHDALVARVLRREEPVASAALVPAEDLRSESASLAEQARIVLIDTPKARQRSETQETDGMMLKAAAPIFDDDYELIGVLYGGTLVNRNYELVEKIKRTVHHDLTYNGKEIGTATVFQDDVRISTNVRHEDGSRAIGTRVSEEVYDRVVRDGAPWVGRAYSVNDWYIAACEPIRDLEDEIIGILYVGILEEKYTDIRNRTILAFLTITFAGALTATTMAYVLSRPITRSLGKLVAASGEVAQGNLDTKVEILTNDEFEDLADTFNTMADALKARDEQLKALAETRVRKSERLAMVGQLAAGVAHELNNPLQGIVAYSLLMLEDLPPDHPDRSALETIVTQAQRCTKIVRGLLDFSRQKKSYKKAYEVDLVLEESLSLVEHQSLFHNIAIEKRFERDLPMVTMDPSQIQQVFMNLIMNAAEAMEGEGLLVVSTRHDCEKETVEVVVRDTGTGILTEDLDQIFVPFFTTKEAGHGVGLGLAISFGIVEEHGGKISVDSEVGKGTTFTVRLPVAKDEPDAAHASRGAFGDNTGERGPVASAVELRLRRWQRGSVKPRGREPWTIASGSLSSTTSRSCLTLAGAFCGAPTTS
jgi:two-component system NtrC family sensor kinase